MKPVIAANGAMNESATTAAPAAAPKIGFVSLGWPQEAGYIPPGRLAKLCRSETLSHDG